ncbi:LCP family protein [Capillimicrobium parvum]|uniref:Polyisoprenyl-teichoic acid--peptidoglycan teichoic acid transferase TagU n=1 Tax=Capillimicrobium parvum TaxID=2884022 RepID=A0A9E6XVQ8_9ACTN|nr:LCP family protein [Capillimicrobium parvum]UGS35080.1 Polyisoprenyl-teichoic acid--peptidoglycan teichoic acid transferase TagU [Capillimicrobium parvum]
MSTWEDSERPPRPGRRLVLRILLAGVVIVLAAAGATATAALLQVKDIADTFQNFSAPLPKGTTDVLADVDAGKPQTILVLGSDRRYIDIKQKNPARSDTIILLRLDPGRGATAVMSIPRDLKVDIDTKRGIVTDKINAAYALGGPGLTVKTVSKLLDIPINHVVNINFGGFRDAVNRLGCVYVDADRRYYNDNNPPNGSPYDYATINVKPGYQKMCGQRALDYVRYRHFDTDLVRAARQQDFLRQAKEQVGVSKLFNDRKELLKIFAKNTQTDIRGTESILQLLKLSVESAKNPVQEVHFRSEIGEEYVTATPEDIQETVHEFMVAKASKGARGTPKPRRGDSQRRRSTSKRSSATYPGTFENPTPAEDQGIQVAVALSKRPRGGALPVYYPKLAAVGSTYTSDQSSPRAYVIRDRNDHKYKAYRLVVRAPGLGQYYGIQGTTWKAAPILDNPSEQQRIHGRTYELFYDGDRLRLVAWRTRGAVYWVSNTLLQTLTNKQMIGIAQSLRRVGT